MQELKKGISNKEQVRVLQGLLNLHNYRLTIDGSFGSGTDNAVRDWQKRNGLKVDGRVGTNTWKSLGVTGKGKNTMILKVPFGNIAKQKLIMHNGQNYNFNNYALDSECNFIINGGMFCMPSAKVDKRYWYVVTNDTIEKGQLINGGNTTNIGIAFCNNRNVGCMYASTTDNSRYKEVDFIGGSPSLYPTKDTKGLGKTYLNQTTKWNMIGVDDNNFYYATCFRGMKLDALWQEVVSNGAKSVINLDGGGSRGLILANKTVLSTDGRGIPQAIGLTVRY